MDEKKKTFIAPEAEVINLFDIETMKQLDMHLWFK